MASLNNKIESIFNKAGINQQPDINIENEEIPEEISEEMPEEELDISPGPEDFFVQMLMSIEPESKDKKTESK